MFASVSLIDVWLCSIQTISLVCPVLTMAAAVVGVVALFRISRRLRDVSLAIEKSRSTH